MVKNKFLFLNNQKKFKVTKEIKDLIKKVVSETLVFMDFKDPCEISVVFTDNEQIREINRERRNIDRPTDVLSFPIISDDDTLGDYDFATNRLILGDIVISLERAYEQSVQYMHSFEREIAFLSVHSTLHLLGYDHEVSKEDEEFMNKTQEEILDKLGIKRG